MFKLSATFIALLPILGLVSAQSPVWGQCGGQGWTGPTTCAAGSACVAQNAYYSQCLPGAAAPPAAPSSAPPAPSSVPPASPTSAPPPPSGGGLASIPAGQLHQITNFGPNPNNVAIYVYKPRQVQANPPLIVASHYCSGTAQAYFSGSKFASLAETHGYVVIFPSSPRSGTCWDVSSDATLKHDGGGDSLGIASAIRFALANWGVDPNRVFAAGTSSGAMMTSVLAGAYPDLIRAGIVDSGVGFGCFAVPGQPSGSWNSQCSQGQKIMTGAQWAQLIKNAFPGFTGEYPKMQVWHGTADTTLAPQNFQEQVKQWTTIFGYGQPIFQGTSPGLPSNYQNSTYGPKFQAILASGVGHTVPLFEQQYLQFFGLA